MTENYKNQRGKKRKAIFWPKIHWFLPSSLFRRENIESTLMINNEPTSWQRITRINGERNARRLFVLKYIDFYLHPVFGGKILSRHGWLITNLLVDRELQNQPEKERRAIFWHSLSLICVFRWNLEFWQKKSRKQKH